MYKKHKWSLLIIFVVSALASYFLKVNYSKIAGAAITVVSIALAVYIGAASCLLGSPYAEKLRSIRDEEDKTKTSLGVLAQYLRTAGGFGIATIITSSIAQMKIDLPSLLLYSPSNKSLLRFAQLLVQIMSSASFGLFFVNVFFIWLILLFLINSITKSVQ